MNKGVVLLSGGLDSATTLYYAKKQRFKVSCLIFNYGQRHKKEIERAKKIAKKAKCDYRVVNFQMPWLGSSLLDKKKKLPNRTEIKKGEIPSTYVPARNIIFLSFAASFSEVIGAKAIFIGANVIDYSGYPDCRCDFINAYQKMLGCGTKAGVEGNKIKILTPLIKLNKEEIIRLALKLKVPLELTWSCYKGEKKPCGVCDSCRLRKRGFEKVGIKDPAE